MFKLHLTSPVKRVFTCNGKQVGEERWLGQAGAEEGLLGH